MKFFKHGLIGLFLFLGGLFIGAEVSAQNASIRSDRYMEQYESQLNDLTNDQFLDFSVEVTKAFEKGATPDFEKIKTKIIGGNPVVSTKEGGGDKSISATSSSSGTPLPSGYNIREAKNIGSNHDPIFEGGDIYVGTRTLEANLGKQISKEENLITLIAAWLRFVLPILSTGAVIAVVYAGFTYVTGGGDDGRYDKAKSIVLWVVIGLLVVLAAYAIVNTIISGFVTGSEPI